MLESHEKELIRRKRGKLALRSRWIKSSIHELMYKNYTRLKERFTNEKLYNIYKMRVVNITRKPLGGCHQDSWVQVQLKLALDVSLALICICTCTYIYIYPSIYLYI